MTTSGKPCRFARRSLPTAGFFTILFLVLWTAASAAQPGPGLAAGLFEIDGNLLSEDPSHVDWFAGAFGPNAGVIDPDSCRGRVQHLSAFLDAAFYRDDHWAGNAEDLSTFSGSKNDDCIDPNVSPWKITAGSGPGKSDITEAYSASYSDPGTGDNWLLLAFATRSTNGSSEMDFEFNAAGLTLDDAGQEIYGTGPDCGRTIGDFIVSINFLSGGAVAQPEVNVWDGVQYIPLDTTPPPGEQPRFLVALNDSTVSAPCGAISPDGEMAVEYIPLQFAEIAINLSALGVDLADYCGRPTSTLGFKTRTSTGFTSALKDVKLFPFQLVPSTEAVITGDLELCAGETTQLCAPEFDMAGNPMSYRWSTGESGRCIELSAEALGEGEHAVSLVVSNFFGCVDSSTVLVKVNPAVQASVADVAVCAGETGLLTAIVSSGVEPFAYAWSTGESGPSITVAASGEYCVTVTDANGCQTQACGRFTVREPVMVSVESLAVCRGEVGTLQASILSGGTAPFTYSWSTGETGGSISVSEAGEYSVTVTDANGCVGTANASLTVYPALEVIVADVAVCDGEEATLRCVASNGTPPFSIEWSTGSTDETISMREAGEYSATVTDANGCVGTAKGTLTVHPAVEVSVAEVAACFGETGTLQAVVTSGTAPLTYAWSNGASTQKIEVGTSGDYTVVVTDANGCVGEATAKFTLRPALEVSVADAAVCFGETATLSASVVNGTAPFTYAWSHGASTQKIEVGTSGDYTVVVTDANGCVGEATATFTVRPELSVNASDLTVCAGESGTLSVQVANGTGPYTYAWSNGAANASITVGEPGEYCVTVTDVNGCEGRACATLTVRTPLKIVLGDVETCAGEAVTLSSNVLNGNGPFSYRWSTGERTESISVTQSGEYCLSVTDDDGCEGQACATVTVLPAVEVRVADAMACAGEMGTLKADVQGGTGPFTFEWNTGATRDRIEAGEAGEYSVIVTDAKGCRGEASGQLMLHSELFVSVDDIEVCEGDEGTLVARIEGGTAPYECSWSTGESTPSIRHGRIGEYCVTVTDANGCEARACGMLLRAAMPVCEIQGPSWVCLNEATEFFVALEAGPSIGSVAAASSGASAETMLERLAAKFDDPAMLELSPSGFSDLATPASGSPKVGKSSPDLDGTASIQVKWSVSDPGSVQFLTPDDEPNIQLRFTAVGRYVIRLEVTSSAGCKSQCEMEVVALDCDAGSCPRTVGFWGRQCEQSGNGDTKYEAKEMYRIVSCVDDHSLALDFRGGPRGFDDFCELIDTDDMNQRTQAYRQYAGMLANICVGNLGFVASNGDSVRLFETTPINFPGFLSRTIGDLVVEMDDLLLSLVGSDLDDPEVKSQYTKIIRVADAINNARGIGRTCFDRDGEPPVVNKDPDPPITTNAFKPAPNPFAGETTLLYTIAGTKAIPVSITVYDIAGRRVRTLESGMQQPGRRMAVWNGQDEHGIQAARGVYYIRANLGDKKFTSRVVLLR